jgi:hypothetical protein
MVAITNWQQLATAIAAAIGGIMPMPLPTDPSDRWARQLGQVDVARVLGAALTPANPVITGVYDALGNRMPAMDAAARAGYVGIWDAAGNRMPTMDAVARAGYVDVIDRWARQLGQVDLARVLGAALTTANPVITGIFDAAGNRMPAMDNAIRPGFVDVVDRVGRLLGTVSVTGTQNITKGQVFNTAIAAATNIFLTISGASLIPTATPRIFRVYAAFSATGIVSVQRTRAAGTVDEKLNSGSNVVATAAYMWDILVTSLDLGIDFRHSAGATILSMIVLEVT